VDYVDAFHPSADLNGSNTFLNVAERPSLTSGLSEADFRSFYWLKVELPTFCREQGLNRGGSKGDLTERIAHFLRTGQAPSGLPKPPSKGQMPTNFSRATVIGAGWRCNEALRAFFVAEVGPRFSFNGPMRSFIKHEMGKTLQDAIDVWGTSTQNQAKTAIGSQFEYNRHMRDFFLENPDATRARALQAWRQRRGERRDA